MIFNRLEPRSAVFEGLDYLVVGSGLFGSVIAERIAHGEGRRVVILEKRDHVGGNAHSAVDPQTGIECHSYGSHIFHTGDRGVWEYINRFCSFNHYRHRVLTRCAGRVYQLPINLATINAFYGRDMTPAEGEAFIRGEISKEKPGKPADLEEKAVSMTGRPLYEALIKGYTAKQWGRPPKELPPEVIARLPVRFDYRSDYFDDPLQGIPLEGYGALFKKLLDHPKIDVFLNTDFFEIRHLVPRTCTIIYTGPLDKYFDYKHGALRWRSLSFKKETLPTGDFQGTTVMNYAEERVPFTRIHEFRHFHGERKYPADRTVIAREYPEAWNTDKDPYYPVNTPEDRKVLARYNAESGKTGRLILGGRLGTYSYLNMDQAIAGALRAYERSIKGKNGRRSDD
jgi:UDP-galactopyranose mutase